MPTPTVSVGAEFAGFASFAWERSVVDVVRVAAEDVDRRDDCGDRFGRRGSQDSQ